MNRPLVNRDAINLSTVGQDSLSIAGPLSRAGMKEFFTTYDGSTPLVTSERMSLSSELFNDDGTKSRVRAAHKAHEFLKQPRTFLARTAIQVSPEQTAAKIRNNPHLS